MQPATPEQAKALIANVFDRASAIYGQVGPAYFAQFGQRLVELAHLAPGMRVLDVASGRGAVLFPAAQAVGTTGSVTGIDISEGMVNATHAEMQQRGIMNATVQVMDAEHLTFSDASFDAVTCGFAIFFMPDPAATLAEFHRVLRAGGRLALSTWGAEEQRWQWYSDLLKSYLPPTADASPSHSAATFDTPEKVAPRITQAGFTDVVVHSETTAFTYATQEDYWQARWSHFGRQSLERLSPDALAAFQAEVFAHLAEMQAREGLLTEMEVLYTIGTKP